MVRESKKRNRSVDAVRSKSRKAKRQGRNLPTEEHLNHWVTSGDVSKGKYSPAALKTVSHEATDSKYLNGTGTLSQKTDYKTFF
jgi:hypothetical protein